MSASRKFANWAVEVFAGDTPIVKHAVDGCFNLSEKRAAAKSRAKRETAEQAEKQALEEAVEELSAQIQTPIGKLRFQELLEHFAEKLPEDVSAEDASKDVIELLFQEMRTPAGRAWVREFVANSPREATASKPDPFVRNAVNQPSQKAIVSEVAPLAPNDLIYCSGCGTASSRDARFCGRCGGHLEAVQTPAAVRIASVTTPPIPNGFVQRAAAREIAPPSSTRPRSVFRKLFVGLGFAAAGLIALVIGLVVLAMLVPNKTPASASASTEVPSAPVPVTTISTAVQSASTGNDGDVKLKQEALVAGGSDENSWSAYLGDSVEYTREGAASANSSWFKLRKAGTNGYTLELQRIDGQNSGTFNPAATLTDNVLSFTEPTTSCKLTITFAESMAMVSASRECSTMGEALSGSYSRKREQE